MGRIKVEGLWLCVCVCARAHTLLLPSPSPGNSWFTPTLIFAGHHSSSYQIIPSPVPSPPLTTHMQTVCEDRDHIRHRAVKDGAFNIA
jgi:hypothetical protein